jgi:hypothetical protein
MENPRNVIGASGYQDSYGYQDGSGPSTSGNAQANDLYEFDDSNRSGNGVTGRVKSMIGGENNAPQYKRDVFDSLCSSINQTLIIPKAFYFFFYAAFGSLFPLLAIYFKQMAFSPFQVGLLFGFRPLVEFLSVPFWANVAERWRKGKIILLGSLLCWILFTLGVGFIQPPVHFCLMHNDTHIFVEKSVGDQAVAAKDSLVSGGYKVVSKRDVPEERVGREVRDVDEADQDGYYSSSINNYNAEYMKNYGGQNEQQVDTVVAGYGVLFKRRKRESPGYINVTKIIKVSIDICLNNKYGKNKDDFLV